MPTIALERKVTHRRSDETSSPDRLQFASLRCGDQARRKAEHHGLDLSEQQALVLEHRNGAHRMARMLLRRWNVRMEPEEIDSLADLALCKAARHFSPEGGAQFSTYSFHYLRGVLIRSISRSASDNWLVLSDDGNIEKSTGTATNQGGDEGHGMLAGEFQNHPPSPEKVLYMKELQELYSQAVSRLSPLERRVVEGVQFGEEQVAQIARDSGYSRGHFSKVLNGVRRTRLQPLWDELKEAA